MKLLSETHESQNDTSVRETGYWRLIISDSMPGAHNMAVDEALLESVIRGGPPVLRFYTWEPATLSLGVNQPLGELDTDECTRRGFGVVRRLTGGRAVLHQHELTYSVIARENDPQVSGGVVEAYRKISIALAAGLRLLGARVELAEPSRALHRAISAARRNGDSGAVSEGSHGAVCFDAASDYELTAGGRKLVGSAQARRGGALLQHGSILLDIDWEAWVAVFRYRSEERRQRAALKLPTRMTSLSEDLGRQVTAADVASALHQGFESALDIELQPGKLTDNENELARQLVTRKYDTKEWTARK